MLKRITEVRILDADQVLGRIVRKAFSAERVSPVFPLELPIPDDHRKLRMCDTCGDNLCILNKKRKKKYSVLCIFNTCTCISQPLRKQQTNRRASSPRYRLIL